MVDVGAGVFKEVGSAITHVGPGGKVILSFNPCGDCGNCKSKLTPYCDHGRERTWVGLGPDESFALNGADGKPNYGNFFTVKQLSSVTS